MSEELCSRDSMMLSAYTQFVGGGYDHFSWEQATGHPRAACSYREWYHKWRCGPDLGDCLSGLGEKADAPDSAAPDSVPKFEEWYASCYDKWCSAKARELQAEVEQKKVELARRADLELDVAAERYGRNAPSLHILQTMLGQGNHNPTGPSGVYQYEPDFNQAPYERAELQNRVLPLGPKTHICADGEVKSWVKWGCVACHGKDYCNIPSHVTRENKRPRDCSKCHPGKNARTHKLAPLVADSEKKPDI